MALNDQPSRLILDCADVGVEVASDDSALIDFVAEYFEPWFRPTRGAAEWVVSICTSASSYGRMQAAMPVAVQPTPCFAHDQQVRSMPAWTANGAVNVCDAERSCFLRLRPGRVELFADPKTRRWRFTLLWIVQEIAATRWRRTQVDMHAATVESAGRALVIAGPKNAGKTTLSFYLMQSRRWGSIANDRTFVGGEAPSFIAAGMPTAVKIRPPTLAQFPELRRNLPPVARPYLYSAAELATAGTGEESADGVDFALTPNQIALRLHAHTRAKAPLAAIVFPEVCEGEAGWRLDPLAPADAVAGIHGNLYGAAMGERPATLFEELDGGRHAAPQPLIETVAAGTECYRLRLGRAAYADAGLSAELTRLVAPR